MKFEHWQSEYSCTVFDPDDDKSNFPDTALKALLTEDGEKFDRFIEGETYEEIQQKHHDLHGWGTYHPMESLKK